MSRIVWQQLRLYSKLAFSILVLMLASATPIIAVVIPDGDGTGNTTPPVDDPGFANVGLLNVGSGVYLGNRWVLTAAHVGAGTITLNGQPYQHVPSEVIRLQNTGTGVTAATDILLFRLEVEPDLPALHAGCRSVAFASEVTLIGAGRQREPDLTLWQRSQGSGDNDDVWTVVESSSESNESGYLTNATREVRWGRNLVQSTNFFDNSGSGDVSSFLTRFSRSTSQHSSAQAVRGDSGGGVFQKNGGIWELVGMIYAIGLKENQPQATHSAVFGGSTLIAELNDYIDQIRSLADFEPKPGDFDSDGEITASDIDQIFDVDNDGLYSCHFDLAEDGIVNRLDIDAMLVQAETLLGDVDLDGNVGFDDFLTFARSYGDTDAGWGNGDFDGDRSVTFGDFILLSRNYGDTFTPTRPLTATAVPEPQALGLLMAGLTVALLCSRNNRQRPMDFASQA